MTTNNKTTKSVRQRNYLARDFDGFRSVLLEYARQYYPERIQDFSEASLGGLFLDMAAYVGDNMSFYLDHLYGEMNSDTVVETINIERTLRNSGVDITGASPAIVSVDFYIEIPVLNDGTLRPDPSLIPTVKAETTILANNGVEFTLIEDINFWKSNPDTGILEVAPDVEVVNGRRLAGTVVSKILKKKGTCTSGNQTTETFSLGEFSPFKRITLSQPNVTHIVNVHDGLGNIYYEVENLTHDVVYRNVLNPGSSESLVKESLKVIPAPYRYMTEVSLSNRSTTLVLGGGSADSLEDDIIPDPSEFSLSLPYSKTFSKVRVNPQKMLQTSTLGTVGTNTTLTVTYRYGGGLEHNIAANTLKSISRLITKYPDNPSPAKQAQVNSTIDVSNPFPASGGEDAPSAENLLALIPSVKNSQERIVTKEDLLARVYTMPSNFGRVFRANIGKNPSNPLSSRLYILSRDANGQLIVSPDDLKINLRRYLNSYRMVSDAIDIVDAAIINLELYFQIIADPSFNKSILLQSIIRDLKRQFEITKFHIGQPIVISDVINTIFSHTGVVAVDQIRFSNITGEIKNNQYSPIAFDVKLNTKRQIIIPPDGGIFEIKYPDINIVGKCIS